MILDAVYFSKLVHKLNGATLNGAYGLWTATSEDVPDPQTGRVKAVWTLSNEALGEDGPWLTTRPSPSGFSYQFYEPTGRSRISGLGPLKYTGDLDQDAQAYMETVDSILQIVEDPERTPYFAQMEPGGEVERIGHKPELIPPGQAFKQKEEPEPAEVVVKSWRDSDNEGEIIRLFPHRPKADDVQDLYQKAKEMRSNRLMNLAKQASQRIESRIENEAALLIDAAKQKAKSKVCPRCQGHDEQCPTCKGKTNVQRKLPYRKEHCGTCASDIPRLKTMLAKQTDPKAKGHLAALLAKAKQAESLTEGKRKRVVLFRPCTECKQDDGKIDECKRCQGSGIDPEFQVRIFEDPRNGLNEILPPRS